MKLTKSYLTQLIKEEINLVQERKRKKSSWMTQALKLIPEAEYQGKMIAAGEKTLNNLIKGSTSFRDVVKDNNTLRNLVAYMLFYDTYASKIHPDAIRVGTVHITYVGRRRGRRYPRGVWEFQENSGMEDGGRPDQQNSVGHQRHHRSPPQSSGGGQGLGHAGRAVPGPVGSRRRRWLDARRV